MSIPVSALVEHDGAHLQLRFIACHVSLGGEFAGNVDIDVACEARAVEVITKRLNVELPGGETSGPALGSSLHSGGTELSFWIEVLSTAQALPDHIIVRWDDAPIARLTPVLHDSLPIDRIATKTEPTGIHLGAPDVMSSTLVRLCENREPAWYALIAFMVGLGLLATAALPPFELPNPGLAWIVVGAIVLGGTTLGLLLARTPYRQVWLDRDRRCIKVIEGRTRQPTSKLADAPGRPLDEFDHVRVYMRWNISNNLENEDYEVWTVALEGPVAHAGGDGRVQVRADVLLLGEWRSDITARRVAARAGSLAGLQILDTGHDKTA